MTDAAMHPTSSGRHSILQTQDVRVTEFMLQPGERLGWHHHSEITDRFYCLQGIISVELREPAETNVLRPGESCAVPPGRAHCPVNPADQISSYLLIQGVGRYDFIDD